MKNLKPRTWQAHPSKLLGFVNRRVSQESRGKFKYKFDTECQYNLILGATIFFHRFYLYVSKTTLNRLNKLCGQEVHHCSNIPTFSLVKSVPK